MKNKLLLLALSCVLLLTVSCSKTAPKAIGVQAGTTGQYFVEGDADWGFEGIKGYECKHYANAGLAVQDLKNKSVKYVLIDQAPALTLANTIKGIKAINIPLSEEEYAFAVDKTQNDLLQKVNAALEKIKQNGKFDSILKAYSTGDGIKPVTSAKKDLSKQDKQLVVATNAAFAPFEYREGDKFCGIDMELAREIADELGMELVLEDMEFDSVVISVGKHGVDLGMAALTVNETRKKSVNFSSSYYNAAQVLVTLENDNTFQSCKTASDVLAILK